MSQRILDTGSKTLIERPINRVPSNWFDLSHDVKISCNMGALVPICVMEVIPGDSFEITSECLMRFQPLISPVMHRINLRSEWFFVANRILWPNWETFISPISEGTIPPAAPYCNSMPVEPGSLANCLGLPQTTVNDVGGVSDPDLQPSIDWCSVLPFAAYQKIYSDWYADEDFDAVQNLPGVPLANNEVCFQPLGDGLNIQWQSFGTRAGSLQFRHWDRDYFTSAKPWPQKGPSVLIPITGSSATFPDVPLQFVNTNPDWNMPAYQQGTDTPIGGAGQPVIVTSDGSFVQREGGLPINFDVSQYHVAKTSDLSISDTAGTINDLRNAEALQTFLEADSRGGTRYIETIKQHFAVFSSDARFQRAEYIGSTFQPITISEVLNTTGTETAPQGAMAGHGISVGRGSGIHYRSEEHGFLMGIMSVLPLTGYSQGIPKMFSRKDRLDYPWPEFANIGEQPILNREVWYQNNTNPATNWNYDDTWGYVPRYSEYRFQGNRIAGDFTTNLNYWHLSRLFANGQPPFLNGGFISTLSDTDGIDTSSSLDRIFAVTDTNVDHVLCHWFHKIKVLRKLPRFVKPNI